MKKRCHRIALVRSSRKSWPTLYRPPTHFESPGIDDKRPYHRSDNSGSSADKRCTAYTRPAVEFFPYSHKDVRSDDIAWEIFLNVRDDRV